MEFSEEVKFLPWVGKHYGKDSYFGKRILVLGESHYGNEGDMNPQITRGLTEDYINGKQSYSFWTKIARVLIGDDEFARIDREIWEHITFYNYVQTRAGDSAGIAPSAKQFQDSEGAFFEVIEKLDPDLILMTGERLWKGAPSRGREGEQVKLNGLLGKVWYYPKGAGEVKTFRILHPSSWGFSCVKWHQLVRTQL